MLALVLVLVFFAVVLVRVVVSTRGDGIPLILLIPTLTPNDLAQM